MRVKDKVGNRYGKLTVVSLAGVKENRSQWLCKCDCGNEKIVWGCSLHGKNTFSCGCLHKERIRTHNLTKTPEYQIWLAMKARCYYPSKASILSYKDKGIIVCDRWKNDFLSFLEDMGNRPSPKHSIDRIDNNGNYEPSNCRWATTKEQVKNRRNTVFIEYNNQKLSASEWSDKLGIRIETLRERVRSGWGADKIFNTPVKKIKEAL